MILSMCIRLLVFLMTVKGLQVKVMNTSEPVKNVESVAFFGDFGSFIPENTTAYMNESQVVGILRQYCPSNYCGFKTKNETVFNFTHQTNVCCLPCDCSDQCFELGSCCYDKDQSSKRPRDEEFEVCTQTTIANATANPLESRLSHLLYQHCSNSENASLVDKCHAPAGESLADLLPVYSPRSGRHYRNRYCAMCDMDHEELTEWNQELQCNSIIELWMLIYNEFYPSITIIDKLKAGLLQCVLYLVPPKNTSFTRCIHPQDMIDSCHHSSPSFSEWSEKCLAYYSPVYSKNMIFKNVFCRMCNEYLNPFVTQDCAVETPAFGQLNSLSVLAILTLGETGHSSSFVDNSYHQDCCTAPTVFNEEINTCLKMKCPLTMMNGGDKCFSVLASISNINLDFRVFVLYPVYNKNTGNAILDEVRSLVMQMHNNSLECKSSILGIQVVGEFVQYNVQMVIYVIQPIDLKDAFATFVNSISRYNANTSNVYRMEIGKGTLLPPAGDSFSFLPFSDGVGLDCESLAVSEMSFCPLVSVDSFTHIGDDTVDVEGMIFQAHEYVPVYPFTTEILICLDTYISRYNKVNYRNKLKENVNGGSSIHYHVLLNVFGIFVVSSKVY